MHSTKPATTIAKVNSEAPKESAPRRAEADQHRLHAHHGEAQQERDGAEGGEPGRADPGPPRGDTRRGSGRPRCALERDEADPGGQVEPGPRQDGPLQPERRDDPVAGRQRAGEGAQGVEGIHH
jgi:hypothetical protein